MDPWGRSQQLDHRYDQTYVHLGGNTYSAAAQLLNNNNVFFVNIVITIIELLNWLLETIPHIVWKQFAFIVLVKKTVTYFEHDNFLDSFQLNIAQK